MALLVPFARCRTWGNSSALSGESCLQGVTRLENRSCGPRAVLSLCRFEVYDPTTEEGAKAASNRILKQKL